MRNIVLIFILGFTITAKGQFAIISDNDGYVKVRNKPSIGNNIIDTLKNGHLIYCAGYNGNWTSISYDKGKNELYGFVYNDRYTPVSTYQSIPIITRTDTSVRLSKDSIDILVTQGKFDKTKHKLKYNPDYKNEIELIDNKKYWGTDGELPKTEYKSITIKIGKHKTTIPENVIENLYEPSLFHIQVNYDKKTNTLFIHSMNSDGAGCYGIIWKVVNGVYKERYLVYGF